MNPIDALWKFGAGALALVALLWGGKCYLEKAARDAVRDEERVAAKRDSVRVTDSVYVVDTLELRSLRTRYDTLVRTRRITDTVWVRQVLAVADSTIRQCQQTVNSCADALRARDTLIAELEKPPKVRRLLYSTSLVYDPFGKALVLRGGPELRLFLGLHLVGEGEVRQSATAGETGIRGALRVGVRRVF
jgi:hypothetical protein